MKRYLLLLVLLSGCANNPEVLPEEGIAKDNAKKEVELFLFNAEKGDPVAQYHYGSVLVRAKGVKRDCKQGVEWLIKSSKNGNAKASFALSVINKQTAMKCGLQNIEESEKYRQIAIEQGYEIN